MVMRPLLHMLCMYPALPLSSPAELGPKSKKHKITICSSVRDLITDKNDKGHSHRLRLFTEKDHKSPSLISGSLALSKKPPEMCMDMSTR